MSRFDMFHTFIFPVAANNSTLLRADVALPFRPRGLGVFVDIGSRDGERHVAVASDLMRERFAIALLDLHAQQQHEISHAVADAELAMRLAASLRFLASDARLEHAPLAVFACGRAARIALLVASGAAGDDIACSSLVAWKAEQLADVPRDALARVSAPALVIAGDDGCTGAAAAAVAASAVVALPVGSRLLLMPRGRDPDSIPGCAHVAADWIVQSVVAAAARRVGRADTGAQPLAAPSGV